MHRFLAMLAVGWSLIASSAAPAQEILGIDVGGGVYSIDPKTGATTQVGGTGVHQYLWHSLARDSQGRLFSAHGRFDHPYAIYEIDPATGRATFVSQTALIGLNSLAFGPGDVLYATNIRLAPRTMGPIDLHEIDLATGADTFIGDTGTTKIVTMTFHQGILWAYDHDLGLMTVDPVTALASDVNPQYSGPYDLGQSICFSDAGALFLVNYALWPMDPVTGVASYVYNPPNFTGIFGGVEFIPGPRPPFTLWMQGVTDGPMQAAVAGATPGAQVAFAWAIGNGGPTPIPGGQPCAGLLLDLDPSVTLAGTARADAQGRAALGPRFVPRSARGTVRVQAVDLARCETSNRLFVSY